MKLWGLVLLSLLLVGCSHHRAPAPDGRLSDSIMVIARLDSQLSEWRGTPYRYGGMSRQGIDCSAFVQLTFRDQFALQLPRSTRDQAKIGTRIDKDELLPGDLIFFKTGSGDEGLHVGIYDTDNQFIHASSSHGVMRSSLNNVYWRDKYWQARRI
ncbi:endopeptidase [Mangrovibacter phragmitis]|uniref:Endopeptidase n=1 Tax=Mangrovibacter phragmitis TaxID=1691903 RepID=A0A1B7L6X5_9ENTR|nr:NlpC/P60 family protein [Mangrovibacter phragmitis]OAT78078.1 endopeptidase [Mangrovibacter phragmitis]